LSTDFALQPAQKAFDLLLLLLVHLQHSLCQECQKVVHYIRPFLLGDEVARRVFGQVRVHPGQDFSKLGIGVELLQLRVQAGAFGRGTVTDTEDR
jgi:hypothetical protein